MGATRTMPYEYHQEHRTERPVLVTLTSTCPACYPELTLTAHTEKLSVTEPYPSRKKCFQGRVTNLDYGDRPLEPTFKLPRSSLRLGTLLCPGARRGGLREEGHVLYPKELLFRISLPM